MPTRVLVAYLLILVMAVGGGAVIWRAIYYSERNVRRRARHARRQRLHAQSEDNKSAARDDPGA